jgi:hypothetical protein
MDIETYHRHAEGLLLRLKAELEQAGVNMAGLSTSSDITTAALNRASAFNPDPAKKDAATINPFDVMLSKFSSDLYNLMMNYAIRTLPESFDQIALVLRNSPMDA